MIAAYHAHVADVKALLARAPKGIQLLRADRVCGRDHLLHAARLAARAIAENRARTADLPTETLLYAAGERQVGKALTFLGLHPGTTAIAAVAWNKEALDALAHAEGWTRDDTLLEGGPAVLDAFNIPAEERAMLPPERRDELILERVALVDVLK
jgi:KEOPS complex subunit Cgi121